MLLWSLAAIDSKLLRHTADEKRWLLVETCRNRPILLKKSTMVTTAEKYAP